MMFSNLKYLKHGSLPYRKQLSEDKYTVAIHEWTYNVDHLSQSELLIQGKADS